VIKPTNNKQQTSQTSQTSLYGLKRCKEIRNKKLKIRNKEMQLQLFGILEPFELIELIEPV
jgi:hypothetical protein